jgi:hypothetical protein
MALRFMRGRCVRSALPLALACAAGCVGPAMAMGDINTAQAELSAAQTAEAPKLAPYEYTLATLYLEQARERMGSADYQQSYEYARKATRFARQAVTRAEGHGAAPSGVPPAMPPVVPDAGVANAGTDAGTLASPEAHP